MAADNKPGNGNKSYGGRELQWRRGQPKLWRMRARVGDGGRPGFLEGAMETMQGNGKQEKTIKNQEHARQGEATAAKRKQNKNQELARKEEHWQIEQSSPGNGDGSQEETGDGDT